MHVLHEMRKNMFLPIMMSMQTSRAMRAPGLRAVPMLKAVALQDWMTPCVSQPHTWMVSVPVVLRAGGPLSTTRIGNRYIFCSCRLKPDRWVLIPAVLSEIRRNG